MTNKKNFRWLEDDINDTLVLKVVYNSGDKEEVYGVFNVMDVLETTGDELDIKTANIDDLINLLTLGIVRFVNVSDNSDILDIPFRKLYLLYQNGNVLGKTEDVKLIPFSDLEVFSIIDGTVRNDFLMFSAVIDDVSEDLQEVMKIAYEFMEYGMQEKFNALTKITMINHRRLVANQKELLLNKY